MFVIKNSRFIVPNLFTSISMLLGLTAIYSAFSGLWEHAAWLILLSAIMDKFDGTAARYLDANSNFGVEYDSFSDFISFGIAPASLMVSYFTDYYENESLVYFKVACASFVLLTAMRLSKYNSGEHKETGFFYGITSTHTGIMIASFFLFAYQYELPVLHDRDFVSGMMIFHGILMIAPFKSPKMKKSENTLYNFLQTFMVILFIVLVIFRVFPVIIYIMGFMILVLGTGFYQLKKFLNRD
ncbi:MAG: CDP-alcohol phosphatidyltransferase family protein [bacterium]